ncbi:hypothetical protein Pst134EB_026200 [Puccinia striiformis f. sp. tritici]|nr:hypothetical protein Pst134EB_026200 [Puccinia striiformis f. sp. tritici]
MSTWRWNASSKPMPASHQGLQLGLVKAMSLVLTWRRPCLPLCEAFYSGGSQTFRLHFGTGGLMEDGDNVSSLRQQQGQRWPGAQQPSP